jgi:ubiquitin carboxyl-terminal hydrolase 34
MSRLIDTCDALIESVADDEDRIDIALNGLAIPLSSAERHLLLQHWTRNSAHILVEKLLQIHQNDSATDAIIVALLDWPETLDHNIFAAIIHGIRRNVSSVPCGPFLRAGLVYCQHSREPRALVNIVMHVSKIAAHLDNTEGKEFLQFFKDILQLQCDNNEMEKEETNKFFLDQALQWGPGLLTYYDTIVRAETEDFLQELILRPASDAAEVLDRGVTDDKYEREVKPKIQAGQRLGVACLDYLQDTYVRPRQQAVRAMLANIQTVIEACQELFDFDIKDMLTRRYAELSVCKLSGQSSLLEHLADKFLAVIPAIKKIMVEEADEEVSGKRRLMHSFVHTANYYRLGRLRRRLRRFIRTHG